jgi:hypothetical protein
MNLNFHEYGINRRFTEEKSKLLKLYRIFCLLMQADCRAFLVIRKLKYRERPCGIGE